MTDSLVVAEPDGTVTISGAVLNQIVRRAAEDVDGVRVRRRGIAVKDSHVTVEVAVRYGEVLPAVGEDVQERIAETLRAMCGIAAAVDVSIEEVLP